MIISESKKKIANSEDINAGKILGINVLDHVIITGGEEYYSFNDSYGMDNIPI